MAHPLEEHAAGGAPELGAPDALERSRELGTTPAERSAGPDPVIGAGLTLLGIFLMGTGGARDAHYVFDVGVAVAMVGAVIFVAFVALSTLKQRRNG